MLRKAAEAANNEAQADWGLLADEAEKKLALRCALFPETIHKAARELDSSCLAAYLLDLAKDFSTFYNRCSVLNASDTALRKTRLEFSTRVRNIIADGLHTLTIGTLESM